MKINLFLYSQDLSNYKTCSRIHRPTSVFLYSQDLSNYKTVGTGYNDKKQFLYSQDLSNYKTTLKADVSSSCFCILKI